MMTITSKYALVIIGFVLLNVSQITFFSGSLGKFNDWYPTVFTIRPEEVKEQFPLDFGPGNPLMGVALIIIYFLMQCKYLYLLKYEKDFEMLSTGYYLFWIFRVVTTMPFNFLYCTERVASCFLIMPVLFISACFSLVICLRRRKQLDNENMTESAKFYFDRCVLEVHACDYLWYSHSVSFWGALALVYKDGPAIELGGADNLRGLFSVEAAGTICIMFYATAVIVWVVADLFLFHHYTKHIKFFYPFAILTSTAVVGRHIFVGKDMNLNNGIYLALGILCILAWIKRGSSSQKTDEKGTKTE